MRRSWPDARGARGGAASEALAGRPAARRAPARGGTARARSRNAKRPRRGGRSGGPARDAGGGAESRGLGGRTAGADARGAALLAGARVAVQGAALDGLVDRLDQRAVLGVGLRVVATRDR